MREAFPERLEAEKKAVEAEIRRAFAGVTREGGVSWSEADVIDDRGSDQQRTAARERDRDRSWDELVDNPAWDHEASSRFTFLDAVGFRYYAAPAMIRCLRDDGQGGEALSYALGISSEYGEDQISEMTQDQLRVVGRFVRFMVAVHSAAEDESCGESWRFAYRVFWRAWDAGGMAG
jgi:hypothetical protein